MDAMMPEGNNEDYFEGYEDLKVHKTMLMDKSRLHAYRKAIVGSSELFKDKTVLDVGSGSGILSIFCAQAGAKKVYAVEGATSIAEMSRQIIEANGFADKIEVFIGPVEEVVLPSKVDIIVSEWMGHYLLHECMLDSVLIAKEKFLQPGGLLFPDNCSLWVATCQLPSYFDYWDNLCGVNMTIFGEEIRNRLQQAIQIVAVPKECLMSDPKEIIKIDLNNVSIEDLNELHARVVLVSNQPGDLQGLCFWFEAKFPSSEQVILATSPNDPITHWKQTVVVFKNAVPCSELDPFALELSFNKQECRRYAIGVQMLEENSFLHPPPCNCNSLICHITAKYIETSEANNIPLSEPE